MFDATNDYLHLYEATLPPLLRYFHVQNISPSGWITFDKPPKRLNKIKKTTTYQSHKKAEQGNPKANEIVIKEIKTIVEQ